MIISEIPKETLNSTQGASCADAKHLLFLSRERIVLYWRVYRQRRQHGHVFLEANFDRLQRGLY